MDFAAAGALCVRHLAALGHRRLALLGAPQAVYDRDTGFAHRTREAILAAAAALGIAASAWPVEPLFPAAVEAVARSAGASALIVHNEGAVDHVLTALRAAGRRVPEHVSVVAICPDDVALAATPRLSNVRIPADDVGRLAVELLLSRLDGARVPEKTLLPPSFTSRGSTARCSVPPP